MIKKSIVMNSQKMKVRYRDTKTKKVWYGEYGKSEYRRGLGWFQWGSSNEDLAKTASITTRLTEQWIEEFGGRNDNL